MHFLGICIWKKVTNIYRTRSQCYTLPLQILCLDGESDISESLSRHIASGNKKKVFLVRAGPLAVPFSVLRPLSCRIVVSNHLSSRYNTVTDLLHRYSLYMWAAISKWLSRHVASGSKNGVSWCLWLQILNNFHLKQIVSFCVK